MKDGQGKKRKNGSAFSLGLLMVLLLLLAAVGRGYLGSTADDRDAALESTENPGDAVDSQDAADAARQEEPDFAGAFGETRKEASPKEEPDGRETEAVRADDGSEEPETEALRVRPLPDEKEIEPNGLVVVIDPGHQRKGDSEKEPNGPDASEMKARVTGGTAGCATGVMEYELNLDISLKLREELEQRGYTVYLTRETHDVNISNMERAQYASSVGADIAVRIHANGAEDSSVSGALALAPSASNPYVRALSSDSQTLGQCILDAYCAATAMKNRGVIDSDDMTGINWSTVPVTILEMGYMTNPEDDVNMEDESYQEKMVRGIADGIDAYFF